jgi:UDP-GlcNAc3NAcA epimerase
MKIITIIGARPQFVKAAAVSRAFSKSKKIEEILLHTGQHFDKNMSEIFFTEMEIPEPKYNLNINGLSHGAMTGQMLEEIEKVCKIEHPDFVMVYGDTNSTIAGALAAKKMGIGVVHIESGLRSYNMAMPEEINRILTDRISDYLFCPTTTAIDNLKKEGYDGENPKIILSGDVMQDAAIYYSLKSETKSKIINTLNLKNKNFVLATIHRQENTDDAVRLKEIVNAFNTLSKTSRVILPLHPRTKAIITKMGLKIDFDVIDPIGYFDMIELLKNCSLVMTDSGGLQKEAYFFNKYCITLRDETEWFELVTNGYNEITGANESVILKSYENFSGKPFVKAQDLYGGGNASEMICHTLENI